MARGAVSNKLYVSGLNTAFFAYSDFILFSLCAMSLVMGPPQMHDPVSSMAPTPTPTTVATMTGGAPELTTLGKVLVAIWVVQTLVACCACAGVRHRDISLFTPYIFTKLLALLMSGGMFLPTSLYLYHQGLATGTDCVVAVIHIFFDMMGLARACQFLCLIALRKQRVGGGAETGRVATCLYRLGFKKGERDDEVESEEDEDEEKGDPCNLSISAGDVVRAGHNEKGAQMI